MKMFLDNNVEHDLSIENAKFLRLKEQVNRIVELGLELKRGCDCDYDYRCGNCSNIIKLIDLAKELKEVL